MQVQRGSSSRPGEVLVLRGEYGSEVRLQFGALLPVAGAWRTARVHGSGVGFEEELGAVAVSAADRHAVAGFLAEASLAADGHPLAGVFCRGRLGLEVMDIEEDSVSIAVTVADAGDGGDVGGLVLTSTRLEWRCAADRFRGNAESTGDGFGAYGLFRPRSPATYQPLVWRVASPPTGSVLNRVRPAETGAPDPGGQVGVVVGLVFSAATDARIALDRLRFTTLGVVGDVLGALPDGRRFALLVLQSDPDLDAVWELDESLQSTRRGRAARRRAFYSAALQARLDPALCDVPEAWLAGSAVIDLPALDRQLYRREGYDWPDGIGLGVGLQVLLAEIVGARMTTLLDAHSEGASCLYPGWEHDCQLDPVSDALAAWADGALTPDLITLARGGSAVRAEPGQPRPFEMDYTPPTARSKRRKPQRPVWPPEDPGEASPLAWPAADDDTDPDTLEEILSLIDPLLWQQLLPEEGFDEDPDNG